MIHPIIHIQTEEIESIDTLQVNLLVHVSENFIGFVSFYPIEKKVYGWILYKLEINQSITSLQELFSEISAKHSWVHTNYKKIFLLQQSTRNILVPVSLNHAEVKDSLFDVMIGNQKNELHLKDLILQQNIINYYTVDGAMGFVLNQKFPKGEWWQVQSILLSKNASSETRITASIWLNDLQLTIEKNGEWLLLQTYNYHTSEDVLYFILNAMKQLEISQDGCKVILQGMIDRQSPLYELLFGFLSHLEFKTELEYQFPVSHELPPHFNASLDQILSCVS